MTFCQGRVELQQINRLQQSVSSGPVCAWAKRAVREPCPPSEPLSPRPLPACSPFLPAVPKPSLRRGQKSANRLSVSKQKVLGVGHLGVW